MNEPTKEEEGTVVDADNPADDLDDDTAATDDDEADDDETEPEAL